MAHGRSATRRTPQRSRTGNADRHGRERPRLTLRRPCIDCGDVIDSGTRCSVCRPKETRKGDRSHPHLHTARWQKLSKKLRKASPLCEHCGETEDLQCGHIIPASERADLIFCIENLRIECGQCNRSRGKSCTSEERQMVESRLAKRRKTQAV